MSRLSETTFLNPFFLAVKMRCITSMGIKILTIDVAGQCVLSSINTKLPANQLSLTLNISFCRPTSRPNTSPPQTLSQQIKLNQQKSQGA